MTQSLGIIGLGAFGSLAAKHLAPHFNLLLHDIKLDVVPLARDIGARAGGLSEAAGCDIVLLAVPVQRLRETLTAIGPHVKDAALIIDVCSVKMRPVLSMQELLPTHTALVGTHPLFGPQSGKKGIKGLNIAMCDVRGGRGADVAAFCADILKLTVVQVSPEEHDREAAYVQGLTHMLAQIVIALDLPAMRFPTRTYELMQQMVEMVRYDSDELFRAIEQENPFADEAKKSFFAAARRLEEKLIRN